MYKTDTICAIASAMTNAGIGIIRVSGSDAIEKVDRIYKGKHKLTEVESHTVQYGHIVYDDKVIDEVMVLVLKAPRTYTTEDTVEIDCHGGTLVMQEILKAVIAQGVRPAEPGEFTKRAFLNGRIDLSQAESVMDVISSNSNLALHNSINQLQGIFSDQIKDMRSKIIYEIAYIESALDDPEHIDITGYGEELLPKIQEIIDQISHLLATADNGSMLKEGIKTTIIGKPNAGKSSLLNLLIGENRAIVTDIAGTTRDVLREHIHIDGMPLHIIDTAGLREATDEVERIGISRAWTEIEQADRIILMLDSSDPDSQNIEKVRSEFLSKLPNNMPVTIVRNKVDLSGEAVGLKEENGTTTVCLSAQTHQGVDLLREHLKQAMGFQTGMEGGFLARRRHLDALEKAAEHLQIGLVQLTEFHAGELLAEELRLVQANLSEITGQFTSDDLLGNIFSSFCIGK